MNGLEIQDHVRRHLPGAVLHFDMAREGTIAVLHVHARRGTAEVKAVLRNGSRAAVVALTAALAAALEQPTPAWPPVCDEHPGLGCRCFDGT